jgi:hypothetical protein
LSQVNDYHTFSGNILLVLNCVCRLIAGPGSGCAVASRPGAVKVGGWLAGKMIPMRSAIKLSGFAWLRG